MSLDRVIIAISIFIGIFLFQKTNPKFFKILLTGFILSFLSSYFSGDLFVFFSLLSFGILVLIYFIYSLYNKAWIPASISFFTLMSFIFKAQYWPYASEIQSVMIIPMFLFIITIFNLKKYKNQISILGIIVAYEISEFIHFINTLFAYN